MKKAITLMALLISLKSFSQDSTRQKKDTMHQPVQDTGYAIIVSKPEIQMLFQLLRLADEKPSIVNSFIERLSGRIQLVLPPKQNAVVPKK